MSNPHSKKSKIYNRLESMKKHRSPYLNDWQETADLVYGYRNRFLGADGGAQTSGETRPVRYDELYNEVALFANNTLSSGMMAGITSPSRPWYKLITPDPEMMDYEPVKTWLDDVQQIMDTVFARSNFYNIMHKTYKSLGAFGVAVPAGYNDFDTVLRFEAYPIGSYCLAMNGKREVDTLFREYSITVDACVRMFGLDNVSKHVRNMYNNSNLDDRIEIVHAIQPNHDRDLDSPLSQDMRFESIYYEKQCDGDKPLRKSGFMSKPFFAPRWDVDGDEVYSSSYPGINSLGSNKSLQIEELDKAVAIEKMHNPPLVADAAMKNGGMDLIAGGVSFIPNMSQMGKPGLQSVYDVNLRVGELTQDIGEKERRIMRHFYADLFLMITEMDRAQITATEIAERKEEKLLMLGPVLQSLNTEMLDPSIDRCFERCNESGILPPPPPELENVDLKVEYISIIAQAQRAVSTASMESTAAFGMNLAQVSPDAMDKIDIDQMIEEHARAKGAPAKVIRSDDEAAAIRDQRNQAMARQQALENAGQMAQGAKTLADAEMTGNDVLSGIMGAG